MLGSGVWGCGMRSLSAFKVWGVVFRGPGSLFRAAGFRFRARGFCASGLGLGLMFQVGEVGGTTLF